MPLYEDRTNAENRLSVPDEWRESIASGPEVVIARVVEGAAARAKEKGRAVVLALDGWYGVPWRRIATALARRAGEAGVTLELVNVNSVFKPAAEIDAYKRDFITDDPAFGVVNTDGRIPDIMDAGGLASLKARLDETRAGRGGGTSVIVYGCGAAVEELGESDVTLYFDKTRQPLLWQMWDGKLAPFAHDEPRADYFWKEYYYCDYYLLHRQKDHCIERMDHWVQAIDFDTLAAVPREVYDGVMRRLVRQPVKEVKIFQPGPWGAYRYKDLFEVPGLECNAWNELAGPELSMLVDLGEGVVLNMPTMNLMQYAEEFVGPHLNAAYPGLFPMDVWLDDGYFPEPTPPERTSMPIHNHPSTAYVRRHFKEPLGRYETYYIAEAYEDANTWMGFRDGCDTEAWEAECRRSERDGEPILDWQDHIAGWPTNVGDLFLIPPGTTHGHGGNEMVLEMDTCPSIAGTEYSFFMYDFCRPSWDDRKKSMTAKPVKMHNEHGFDMDRFRRASWVRDHLIAKPEVVKWTKEYSVDRYGSCGPMPFEIERVHFTKRGELDTEGRFCHVVTLTVGDRVKIRSKASPDRGTEIDLWQSAIVPACFGEYEFVNVREGQCTIVLIRWKKG